MQRGWLRVMVRYSLVVLVEQGRLSQEEAAREMGLSTLQVRRVLNYWRYPLTNAVVEGKHNRVKVLKWRAYGYRNDATFLLRILNLVHTD